MTGRLARLDRSFHCRPDRSLNNQVVADARFSKQIDFLPGRIKGGDG